MNYCLGVTASHLSYWCTSKHFHYLWARAQLAETASLYTYLNLEGYLFTSLTCVHYVRTWCCLFKRPAFIKKMFLYKVPNASKHSHVYNAALYYICCGRLYCMGSCSATEIYLHTCTRRRTYHMASRKVPLHPFIPFPNPLLWSAHTSLSFILSKRKHSYIVVAHDVLRET